MKQFIERVKKQVGNIESRWKSLPFKTKNIVKIAIIVLLLGALPLFIYGLSATNQNFDIRERAEELLTPLTTNTTYNHGVLVLKYFPLTEDGLNIDIAKTGDVGQSYETIRQKTVDITNNLVADLPKATKYLGYANPESQPAINYNIVDTKEYTEAPPTHAIVNLVRYLDYSTVLTANNICDYVDNQGVDEVWVWAYQGPNYGDGHSYLEISESKMSSPYGDISNSHRFNEMPKCARTYTVYTFNYGRGTGEAMESWGHQIEAELSTINYSLFRTIWQGPNYPQTLGVNGRCGSVHNPPNARSEYDRHNPTPQKSDCLAWNPDSPGALTEISCANWGCADNSDSDNSTLNYMIWNWQNLPGRNNTILYQGSQLRNWWDIHGDFDKVMSSSRYLTLTPPPTPTQTAIPATSQPQLPTPPPNPTSVPVPSGYSLKINVTYFVNAKVGELFTQYIYGQASGYLTDPILKFQISSLPAGLALNTSTCLTSYSIDIPNTKNISCAIQGTPITAGSYKIGLALEDSVTHLATGKSLPITVLPASTPIPTPTPTPTPYPAGTQCWNKVLVSSGSYYWPDACRGIYTSGGCAAVLTKLLDKEVLLYKKWISDGKPYIPNCDINSKTPTPTSTPIIYKTPKPTATPTPAPLPWYCRYFPRLCQPTPSPTAKPTPTSTPYPTATPKIWYCRIAPFLCR